MAQQMINLGSAPNDGTGDKPRPAGDKINDNFTELYAAVAAAIADIALKANAASAALTGTPTAPTAAGGTNTTQIATTAFVVAEIAALIAAAPGALNTLDELANALGDDANFAATVTAALAGKLAAASNLSDVANAATARGNLGARAAAPSVQAVTSSATVTPTFGDDLVKITAQAAGLTLANPTGTAVPGWGLVIRIKDNGTARSIAYGSQYRAIGVTLPTTTVIGKTLYLGLIYNHDDTKWDVVAVAQEA